MLNIFDIRIIYAFIFLQPVLDLLTSIMTRSMTLPLTVGVISRSLFMIYMFLYVMVGCKWKDNLYKLFKVIFILIAIYLIIFIGFNFATKELRFVITEIKGILKVFYFPIVLTGLFIYTKQNNINISNKLLTYILMMYTGVIFIATITGTYYRSYNDYLYGMGSIGWFFGANEIGSAICILMPFTIINFIQNKVNVVNCISLFLCIFSSLYIGTKVPLLGFAGTLALIFVYTIIQAIINRKRDLKSFSYKKSVISLIIAGLLFCIVFYKSPAYQNIEFNYGHIIHKYIKDLQGKYKKEQINDESNVDNKENKNEENTDIVKENEKIEEEVIPQGNPHVTDTGLEALLSNRESFSHEVKLRFKNANVNEKLLGLGYVITNIHGELQTDKSIELDFQDIFYRHGIVGSTLYFAPIFIICVILIRGMIKNSQKLNNIDSFGAIVGAFLGIGIANFAGHVLTAPGVSIYVIVSIIILCNIFCFGDDINEDFDINANL